MLFLTGAGGRVTRMLRFSPALLQFFSFAHFFGFCVFSSENRFLRVLIPEIIVNYL